MAQKLIVDVATGTVSYRDLTEDEMADYEKRIVEADARLEAERTVERTSLAARTTDLKAVLDAPEIAVNPALRAALGRLLRGRSSA